MYGKLDEKVGDSIIGKWPENLQPLWRDAQAVAATADGRAIFDIQDIGCRFYTYISTMYWRWRPPPRPEEFTVLDRVNLIGATAVEGPVLPGPTDFIAFHDIPIRHGMTVGELARMFTASAATTQICRLSKSVSAHEDRCSIDGSAVDEPVAQQELTQAMLYRHRFTER